MKITKEMVLTGAKAAHDYLDARFPDGALPGGVQLFANPGDYIDPLFRHEDGCVELATAVLKAALGR